MHHARMRKGVEGLVLLFMLAFAARASLGAFLLRSGPSEFVLASDDGDAYDAAARWQAFGTQIEYTPRMQSKWAPEVHVMDRWPQGYWLFLAAQYSVFGSAYVSTIVLQALIGAAGVVAGFGLARKVLSQPGAALAGIALAFSSTGIFLAAALYAESLYVPLVLYGLALVSRPPPSGRLSPVFWVWPALAGLAFGLAEVTRPLALPLFGFVLAWCLWRSPQRTVTDRVRDALSLCLGFGLGLAPFVLHDIAVVGRITIFTVGGTEAFADLRAAAGIGLLDRVLLLFGTGGWAPLGEPLISNLGNAAAPFRLLEALVGALGMVCLVRRGRPVSPIGWLLTAAILAIVLPPLFLGLPLVRYRAAADPLIIVAMVASLEAAWRVTAGARRMLAATVRSGVAAR